MSIIKKHIELLAPAGGIDQLKAAVRFGADAVYLATDKFGMRARAANFSMSDMPKMVEYAHSNNVKVYVTCNVLMHDKDIEQLPDYFTRLAEAEVDAFIIGDMGAASIAQQVAPKVALHVSTQASVANAAAAKVWVKLGAKRIVLAREMSLEEITIMKKALEKDSDSDICNLELEAFVHGAMCMSVSGRCLISSYLTGRSANKGHCTQPCRWGYNLQEEKRPGQNFGIEEDDFGTYIMNSKDLNMLASLDKLASAGISSIKIEGRNKKALYVATIVNAYRHVLDALEEDLANCENQSGFKAYKQAVQKWEPQLETVSHRPYSTGFYFGQAEQSQDYDGYEQNRVHVADVLNCKPYDGKYMVTVLCRNHFEDHEILEALIPKSDIADVQVENLVWNNKNVEVANRAKEEYSFVSDAQIPEGSYLRSKTFLRTSRTKYAK